MVPTMTETDTPVSTARRAIYFIIDVRSADASGSLSRFFGSPSSGSGGSFDGHPPARRIRPFSLGRLLSGLPSASVAVHCPPSSFALGHAGLGGAVAVLQRQGMTLQRDLESSRGCKTFQFTERANNGAQRMQALHLELDSPRHSAISRNAGGVRRATPRHRRSPSPRAIRHRPACVHGRLASPPAPARRSAAET